MKIADVLQPLDQILVVRPDDVVATVADRFRVTGQSLACVCLDRRLVGVVTTADLRLGDADVPMRSVMTPRPVTCAASDSTEQALDIMQQHEVRSLPVVDKGHLMGLVSFADVLRRTRAQAKRDVEFLTAFVFG
jgi:CBS domain-containing protein